MGFLSKIGEGLLGSVGSVVSGGINALTNLHNNKQSQFNYENSISTRVKDADRNGLSRYIAVTGNNPQAPFFNSADTSFDTSGIQRALEKEEPSEEDKTLQGLQIRNMELQNRSQELENMKLEKELASIGKSKAFDSISPFPDQSIATSVMESSGSPLNYEEKLSAQQSPLRDYAFTRSLDAAIKNVSLVPLMNGGVQVVPAKDLMDWLSEDLQDKFGFKYDLFRNAEYYAAAIARRIRAPYFWVNYNPFGAPTFHFSRNEKEYLKHLNDKPYFNRFLEGLGSLNYSLFHRRGKVYTPHSHDYKGKNFWQRNIK